MSMNGIDLKPYIASTDLALEWKNVMIFLSINSNYYIKIPILLPKYHTILSNKLVY